MSCLFLSTWILGTLGYANKKLTHIGRRVENETSAVRSHESSGYGHGETKLPKKNGEGSRKNSPNWTYLRSIRIDSSQSKFVIGNAGSNFSVVDYALHHSNLHLSSILLKLIIHYTIICKDSVHTFWKFIPPAIWNFVLKWQAVWIHVSFKTWQTGHPS